MEKVWLNQYEPGVPHTIELGHYRSLVDMTEENYKKYHDRPAFSNMGCALSYQKLNDLSKQFAAFLQTHLKCQKGDRLGIMLPNVLQYPVVLFGAQRAGLILVNINPLYTPREIIHILKDSGTKTLVVLENFAHTLEKVKHQAPELTDVTVITTKIGDLLGLKGYFVNFVVRYIKKMIPPYNLPGALSLRTILKKGAFLPFHAVSLTPEDIAYLQYTGGTTGTPKGAMLTHGNMMANVLQASAWMINTLDKKFKGGIITALPLYHIFALTANCLTFMRAGLVNILITNPKDIKGLIKELKRQPFSFITGVNTLFNALLHHPLFQTVNFKDLAFTLGGGMAVQESVANEWQKVTGVPLIQAYGLTEASPGVTMGPMNSTYFDNSVGLPICSTDIKVCNEKGEELSFEQAGELYIKGPQVMLGYWKDEKSTEQVLKEGWLRTGDIAMVDTKGFVRIVDRKKDMILVSGFNVYPNEVEAVLSGMPGVKEVAVVGVKDSAHGERVKAYIVLSNPLNNTITAKKIIAFCREQLTNYKVPKEIEFRTDLPKTNVGKILRRALKEEKGPISL